MQESQYNTYFGYGGDTIVFNALSKEYVLLKGTSPQNVKQRLADKHTLESQTRLEKANILTELSKEEEQSICDSIFYAAVNNGVLRLTIVTTQACNFDCMYCAQRHINNFMEQDTYNKIYQLILRNINTFTTLKLVLFGGEPTLALKHFEPFLSKVNTLLRFYHKHLIGVMITNGYLLSEEIVRKLYQLGITQFQITLDASSEFHDRSRILKNGKKTFERIYQNLLCMCQLGDLPKLSVVILINSTYEMLVKIDSWIHNFDVFIDDPRFYINLSVVENRGGERILEFTDTLVSECDPLYQAAKYRLGRHVFWGDKIRDNAFVCESILNLAYTIDWDGKVRACSQLTADNIIGELKKGGRLSLSQSNQLFRIKNHTECRGCSIEPLCHGKSCGLRFVCNKEVILSAIKNNIIRELTNTPTAILEKAIE